MVQYTIYSINTFITNYILYGTLYDYVNSQDNPALFSLAEIKKIRQIKLTPSA